MRNLCRYSRSVTAAQQQQQQYSFDSGLDLSSPLPGMYGTALLIKEVR